MSLPTLRPLALSALLGLPPAVLGACATPVRRTPHRSSPRPSRAHAARSSPQESPPSGRGTCSTSRTSRQRFDKRPRRSAGPAPRRGDRRLGRAGRDLRPRRALVPARRGFRRSRLLPGGRHLCVGLHPARRPRGAAACPRPRRRTAADLYNRGLTEGLATPDGNGLRAGFGSSSTPLRHAGDPFRRVPAALGEPAHSRISRPSPASRSSASPPATDGRGWAPPWQRGRSRWTRRSASTTSCSHGSRCP